MFILALTLACKKGEIRIVLDVVSVMDTRLPTPSATDVKEMLAEAKRTIKLKLDDKLEIEFRDHGVKTPDEFFADVPYVGASFYAKMIKKKYDTVLQNKAALFAEPAYKAEVLSFLKNWDLKSLRGFFPKTIIASYEDAYAATLRAYHDRVAWLKGLKTAQGEPLLVMPPRPYQSYVDWKSLMFVQEKYDVVLTNTLIVMDYATTPYPHSVTKHAKVGGSSFESPKRKALAGGSLLVNTIETTGRIPGLSHEKQLPAEMANKLLGAILFAHEFAHAFYLIPDVYDHSASCLMNSSMEGADMEKSYRDLLAEKEPCKLCHPWIASRRNIILAEDYLKKGESDLAGDAYLQAAAILPERIDKDRRTYIEDLYDNARSAFKIHNNTAKLHEVDALIRKLKDH